MATNSAQLRRASRRMLLLPMTSFPSWTPLRERKRPSSPSPCRGGVRGGVTPRQKTLTTSIRGENLSWGFLPFVEFNPTREKAAELPGEARQRVSGRAASRSRPMLEWKVRCLHSAKNPSAIKRATKSVRGSLVRRTDDGYHNLTRARFVVAFQVKNLLPGAENGAAVGDGEG